MGVKTAGDEGRTDRRTECWRSVHAIAQLLYSRWQRFVVLMKAYSGLAQHYTPLPRLCRSLLCATGSLRSCTTFLYCRIQLP